MSCSTYHRSEDRWQHLWQFAHTPFILPLATHYSPAVNVRSTLRTPWQCCHRLHHKSRGNFWSKSLHWQWRVTKAVINTRVLSVVTLKLIFVQFWKAFASTGKKCYHMTGFSHCSALLTEICNLTPGAAAPFSKQQLGGLHWSLAAALACPLSACAADLLVMGISKEVAKWIWLLLCVRSRNNMNCGIKKSVICPLLACWLCTVWPM